MEQLAMPLDLGQVSDWTLASVEKAHLRAVLGKLGFNLTRASARLGIDRRTLQRKLVRHGLYDEFRQQCRKNSPRTGRREIGASGNRVQRHQDSNPMTPMNDVVERIQ